MSESPHLLVERTDHIVTLTFNRPESKNAIDLEVLVRLWDAWKMIDEDPEIRCAILTGAGGDFCAGADLKQMHGNNEVTLGLSASKKIPICTGKQCFVTIR